MSVRLRIEDVARLRHYTMRYARLIDKELVTERVFAAVNFVYDPEVSLMPTGPSERDSTFALATSVTTQILPGTFVGAEARYLRKYDGLGFNSLAGQGLFLGPTTFVRRFQCGSAPRVSPNGAYSRSSRRYRNSV